MPAHNNGYAEAFDVIDRLDAMTCIHAVLHEVERIGARYGFDSCIFTGLSKDLPFDQSVLARTWPAEFIAHYTRENFIRHDPVAQATRESTVPFEWDEHFRRNGSNARAAEVMRCAADYGIRCGFTIPIHGPGAYDACISMTGSKIDLPAYSRPALHLMGLYAFDRVQALSAPEPRRKAPLTAREREVLTWVAQGKSAWEIGEILSIAKRTVDEHVQTSFQKLGAVNRTQAVALAVRDRLIHV
jgi:LuxR family transcriptional regulator, quorum-sensing system regulator BjaR1